MKLKQDEQVILDAVELSQDPPTEIELFKAGWNDTKKGKFLFDSEAEKAVLAAAEKDGRDLIPFDIGHGMLSGTDADRHKAAGWFKLGVKDGNLMAQDIEWTPKTYEALSNREYRFHSPALTFDSETRRVTSIINVALTNIPATNKQSPIVLDSNAVNGEQTQKAKYDMKLVALLGVTEDKIEEAVAQLHADHAALVEEKAELSQKYEEAKAKLVGLEVAAAKAERAAQIEVLSAEGKLAPAQHEFAASLSDDLFKSFVETLSAPAVKREAQEVAPASASVELSAVEKGICAQLGISESDFISQKAKN